MLDVIRGLRNRPRKWVMGFVSVFVRLEVLCLFLFGLRFCVCFCSIGGFVSVFVRLVVLCLFLFG